LLLLEKNESEKLPNNTICTHYFELTSAEGTLRIGPIYHLTLEEEELRIEYLGTIIQEGEVRQLSKLLGSLTLCVPNPNGKCLRLCMNYRHLKQNTITGNTHVAYNAGITGSI